MKDDSSNYADWVRKLSIVLSVAQKVYVLNATLGVLNLEHHLWMLRTSDIHVSDDYTIVQCKILNGLEARRRRCVERSRNIRDVLRVEIEISCSCPC